MPVGINGPVSSVATNLRTNSGNPGHATEFNVPDPKVLINQIRFGGSKPTWDDYGVVFMYEVVNPPTGSEASVIYSKVNLFVNEGVTVYLQVRGV